MRNIHPTSLVDENAALGDDVQIGPFCIIGPNVEIGDGTVLHSHITVQGHTKIGKHCEIFPFASLGHIPQDLKYSGETTYLEIGDNNRIRENVTMNPGTKGGGGTTRIGSNCLFMIGVHVAHDCLIGDHVILVNNVTLAGHVELADHVIMAGMSGLHQFCKAGKNAFIGAGAIVVEDVIPFGMVMGNRAYLSGLNLVGLKRSNYERQHIHDLRNAYKLLFMTDEKTLAERMAEAEKEFAQSPLVEELLDFLKAGSPRGFCLPNNPG